MANSLAQARAIIYTCQFTFRTLHVILSCILRKRSPFRYSITPDVLPFNACRAYTQPKQTTELRKYRVHPPLLLAKNLGRVRVQ